MRYGCRYRNIDIDIDIDIAIDINIDIDIIYIQYKYVVGEIYLSHKISMNCGWFCN